MWRVLIVVVVVAAVACKLFFSHSIVFLISATYSQLTASDSDDSVLAVLSIPREEYAVVELKIAQEVTTQ